MAIFTDNKLNNALRLVQQQNGVLENRRSLGGYQGVEILARILVEAGRPPTSKINGVSRISPVEYPHYLTRINQLRLVCSSWNGVIVNQCPELWAKIIVPINPPHTRFLHGRPYSLGLFLQRSKDLALSVHIVRRPHQGLEGVQHERQAVLDILAELYTHRERFETLVVHTSDSRGLPSFERTILHETHFPNLRSLILDCDEIDVFQTTAGLSLVFDTQSSFHQAHTNLLSLTIDGMNMLALLRPGGVDAQTAFSNALRSLVFLTIQHLTSYTEGYRHSALPTLFTCISTLSSLRHLSFDHFKVEGNSRLPYYLPLTIPQAKPRPRSLVLRNVNTPSLEILLFFIQPETLTLDRCVFTHPIIRVHALGTVELELIGLSKEWIPLTALLRSWKGSHLSLQSCDDDFTGATLRALIEDLYTRSHTPLSELKHLTVTGCMRFDDNLLAEMLRLRSLENPDRPAVEVHITPAAQVQVPPSATIDADIHSTESDGLLWRGIDY